MNTVACRTFTDALGLGPAELVAFVGAGGKTTALRLLLDELAGQGKRVIVTTTTAMLADQIEALGPVMTQASVSSLTLSRMLDERGRVAIVTAAGTSGKVLGLSPAAVDAVWETGSADHVLVEADGSRGLPFKAFAPHEPQVPATATTIVDVAALDVLGSPLTDEHVHRAATVASSLGVAPGSEVTTRLLADGLRVHAAHLRRTYPRSRLVILLNKAESAQTRAAGAAVASALLEGSPGSDTTVRPDRVVVASLVERQFAVEEQA